MGGLLPSREENSSIGSILGYTLHMKLALDRHQNRAVQTAAQDCFFPACSLSNYVKEVSSMLELCFAEIELAWVLQSIGMCSSTGIPK